MKIILKITPKPPKPPKIRVFFFGIIAPHNEGGRVIARAASQSDCRPRPIIPGLRRGSWPPSLQRYRLYAVTVSVFMTKGQDIEDSVYRCVWLLGRGQDKDRYDNSRVVCVIF